MYKTLFAKVFGFFREKCSPETYRVLSARTVSLGTIGTELLAVLKKFADEVIKFEIIVRKFLPVNALHYARQEQKNAENEQFMCPKSRFKRRRFVTKVTRPILNLHLAKH